MIELEEIYQSMIKIFQRYLDMDARYYKIVALWTIGTHFHKIFQTFPYLYLNATRGSGKTRLLKLISYFSRNGSVIGLPSEAFIFREAEAMTFCFDEMDNIQQKEKNDLRLLLNTAYKKGLFVPRMKKNKEGQIETEKFETFAPVAIANIWGLESVLQDRCVSMILEKSHNAQITKKVEAWELEKDCIKLKERLQSINTATYEISFFGITRLEDMAYIPVVWNAVLENLKEEKDFNQAFGSIDWDSFKLEPGEELLKFLRMLYEVRIEGRDLELWLPLFFIAYIVNEDTLKDVIEIATGSTEQKMIDEIGMNIDSDLIAVLSDFIKGKKELEFFRPNEIKAAMVEVVGDEKTSKDGSTHKEAPYWLTVDWIGKALKRLNLVKQKRRRNYGVEIMLNFGKIIDKSKALGYSSDPTQATLDTLHTQDTPKSASSVSCVACDTSASSVSKKCYKCHSTDNLTEIKDEYDPEHKNYWMCESCIKEAI